jgi:outer membrane protein OmpA-like peptidoglycan-associated protein/opacity protein-like surface antigen
MKKIIQYIFLAVLVIAGNSIVSAQTSQPFNNSLRVQYGLMQYNKSQNDFINSDNNYFQNIALTYRLRLGSVSGLNITGRHYQWQLNPNDKLSTYAAQAMWVFHARRISSSWSLSRLTPYIGIGAGYENHKLENSSGSDSSFSNLYIPLEAGVLYNLSSRWSIGIFGEYKFASIADIKKLVNEPSGSVDIVNTAGITLAYHFGRKSKTHTAPVVFTNPLLKTGTLQTVNQVKSVSRVLKYDKKPIYDSVQKIITIEKVRIIRDSTTEAPIVLKDSAASEYDAITTPVTDGMRLRKENLHAISKDSIETKVAIVHSLAIKDSIVEKDKNDILRGRTPAERNDKPVLKMEIYIDSLTDVINNLNQRLDSLKGIGYPVNNSTTDTLIIPPAAIEMNDEPAIVSLKQSYNNLGEMVERNSRLGNLNDTELQNIKVQTGKLNDNINSLSNSGNVSNNQLSNMYAAMAALQLAMSKSNAVTQNRNDYSLQTQISDMQNKLDRTLVELEQMRKPPADSVQTPEPINTNSIESLRQQQQQVENKLKEIEAQNLELKDKLNKIENTKTKVEKVESNDNDNILYTINFGINSSEIQKQYQLALRNLADSFKNTKGAILLLSGFADKSGKAAYNLKLSQLRVNAVKRQLLANGLDEGKLVERFFGSNKAEKVNAESERKVVIRLLNQ